MLIPCLKNFVSSARVLCSFLLLTLLTASCSAGGAYWIPPSSTVGTDSSQPLQNGSRLPLQPIAALAAISLPGQAALEPPLEASVEEVPSRVPAAVESENYRTSTPATPTPEVEPTGAGSPTAVRISPQPSEAVDPVGPVLPTSTPGNLELQDDVILYYAQGADTLQAIAVRFGVDPSEVLSDQPVPEAAYLTPGQLLVMPRRLADTTSPQRLIPDSEVVFSPSAAGFDPTTFAVQAGGRLGAQQEYLKSTGSIPASEVVARVALENSINPRLLLALLEYQSGWVYGKAQTQAGIDYPMGLNHLGVKGLYNQLRWAVDQLSTGYYAYREGRITELRFEDGVTARLAPELNAGTAAMQYFFSKLYQGQAWLDALDPETGFPALYARMFGDPWQRASLVEPLFPAGAQQPPLILPFERNLTWSYTGGPHGAWDSDGAYAALDFAPGGKGPGCLKSRAWTLAAASGLVVRSGNGLVVLDLDGDGREETGWVLTYLHVASQGAIPAGSWVDTGDPLGHPSCEGGFSTGTHVHIARKYNGEWIPADGPLPFNLGGWIAHAGEAAYQGTLTRGEETLKACTCSSANTFITRTENDP